MSLSFEAWKSEIRVPACLGSGECPFPGYVLTWPSLSFSPTLWVSLSVRRSHVSSSSSKTRDTIMMGPPTWPHLTLVKVLVTQSCLTLCDPVDCSPPGSSVHGLSQAGILEWVAIPFSRESSQPRDWTLVSYTAGRFFTIWATGEAPSNPNYLPKASPPNPTTLGAELQHMDFLETVHSSE